MTACHERPSPTVEIWTWYDLNSVRSNLGGTYLLMKSLDSTTRGYQELASPTANGGKGWQPIGSRQQPFNGSFDGQGYEIKDIFIKRPGESDVGLFGAVDKAGTVQNVKLVNADVTGEWYAGSLVGTNYGTVRNCDSSGAVTGSQQVGGLVGGNAGTVSDCAFAGSVSGSDLVGSLAGGSTKTISSCRSSGTVTGESRVGGLVGGINGVVTNSYSSASASGDRHVGGLVGYANGIVSNCHATGTVTGDSYVGGLVGWNRDIIRNCYSFASVTGNWLVGGLVGQNRGSVTNTYSTGSVSGSDDVGGLVGRNYQGTVSNSFWDRESSGMEVSDGGTGKTTSEMKTISTFSGWDIIAVNPGETNPAYIWNIVDGQTYPFLSGKS